MDVIEVLRGVAAGTFTGLTPGVHVNTIAAVGGSFLFLFSMGLTHTFLDAIPSAFLGVPDEGTVLSILPAHRMVLKGEGMKVVKLAVRSSFLAVLFSVSLYPLYAALAPLYRPIYGKLAVVILILLMMATDRRVSYLLILATSGALGLIVLRRMTLNQPFFHLFTGLFGLPVLIHSFLHPGEVSDVQEGEIKTNGIVVNSMIGSLLGMLASLLPAFTASQAAVIGTLMEKDDEKFLSIVYSVNTSNFLFCVFNYHLTGRVRNGVVASMNWSPSPQVMAAVAFGVAVTVLAYGELVGRVFISLTSRLDQRKLSITIITFLVLLSIWFDGLMGLVVLGTATLIGLMPLMFGTRRTACMGVLMVPVIVG